ncbi:exopolysaccharide biosynthesis protein [Rhodobacterales bacterium LSUCC0031]|nr:exopolysaccharide biosynthesis protein [Rhodobacterales bacterium LSUCC0031]
MGHPVDHPVTISARLTRLVADADGDTVTLAWVLDQLHERAFGLFSLVLALPCCIPFLYGVPQVVALPLLFIAAQIVLGWSVPWLPRQLGERRVTTASLAALAQRADPWLRRIEAVSRPRLAALTRRPLDQLVGLALLVFSISILVPVPGTNTVPGIAVAIMAIGMLQRDGLLVVFGLILGAAWIGTLLVAGATAASLLLAWIGG